MNNRNKRINGKVITYILAIVGIITYISLIFNKNVWLDEAFTASLIRTDFINVIDRSIHDTLPPLYNIFLKLSTDLFGYSVPVMKIVSILPMAGAILLGSTFVYQRFGVKTSCLYIICIVSMPQLLYYGLEIRMYSLGFFFATGAGIFAVECIYTAKWKYFLLLSVMTALAGYTHHFALVSSGFVYLFFLIYCFSTRKDLLQKWMASAFLAMGLYFPCFLITLKQMGNVHSYFSMPDVTLPVLIKYIRYPFTVGFTPLTLLLAASMAFILLRFFIYPKNPMSFFLFSYFAIYLCVLVFGAVASRIMSANIFVDRYLFPSFGLLWLFFSIEVGKLHTKEYSFFVAIALLVGVMSYQNIYKLEYTEGVEEMLAYFDENQAKYNGYLVPEGEYEVMECMTFYYPELIPYTWRDKEVLRAEIDYTVEIEEASADIWQQHLFYITERKDSPIPPFLKEKGYSTSWIQDFHFDRYTFSLYHLNNFYTLE